MIFEDTNGDGKIDYKDFMNGNQGNGNQGNDNQGNDNQGNGNQGNGNQGNGNQDNGNQGNGNQDNGNQGNGNQDNGDQGNGNQDNGNQGNGNQDNGNQGNGNQDNGNQGNGNQGNGNQGNGTQDDGPQGDGNGPETDALPPEATPGLPAPNDPDPTNPAPGRSDDADDDAGPKWWERILGGDNDATTEPTTETVVDETGEGGTFTGENKNGNGDVTIQPTDPPVLENNPILIGGILLVIILAACAIVYYIRENQRKKRRKARRTPRTAPATAAPMAAAAYADKAPIVAAAYQHIGAREDQQDSYGVSRPELYGRQGVMAVVADGMGGLSNGKAVSSVLVRTFLDGFPKVGGYYERTSDILLDLTIRSNAQINQMLQGAERSGSTLVATLVRDGYLYFLTVGDSRVYLYRGGALIQLNREHIYQEELAVKAVNQDTSVNQIRTDRQAHSLTSYFGIGRIPSIDRNDDGLKLVAGDRILLASDGVFGTLSQEQMEQALQHEVNEAAQLMGDMIQNEDKPYQDNNTLVILEYNG